MDYVIVVLLGFLAGVLAGARLVLTGDTGPMHLAAAVRAPVVGKRSHQSSSASDDSQVAFSAERQ